MENITKSHVRAAAIIYISKNNNFKLGGIIYNKIIEATTRNIKLSENKIKADIEHTKANDCKHQNTLINKIYSQILSKRKQMLSLSDQRALINVDTNLNSKLHNEFIQDSIIYIIKNTISDSIKDRKIISRIFAFLQKIISILKAIINICHYIGLINTNSADSLGSETE